MTTSCFHCGQLIDQRNDVSGCIDDQLQHFCCNGCLAVCQAIYGAGMAGFYRRVPENKSLNPPPEQRLDVQYYDLEPVQAEFIKTQGPFRQIWMMVDGIHCAACVWLIEHTLQQLSGVQEIHVNLSLKHLKLVWDQQQINLSEVIERIQSIGYQAIPFNVMQPVLSARKKNSALRYRMAFAGFAMMNLLWISIALYSGASDGEFRHFFHWISFSIATPTLFYAGWPFLTGAYHSLKQKYLGMDVPIALGALTSYGYSVYITVTQAQLGDVYYDTVVNFIFVILIGRYLEALSKTSAVSATQRLMDLQPQVALKIEHTVEAVVPVRSLKENDIVRVKPGEKLPIDGIVISGCSEINESVLTGESLPIIKAVGDHVFAGSMNTTGSVDIKTTAILNQSALGHIIDLVESAQATKAPIQRIADKVVPWFVLVILSLAMMTFGYWINQDFELALLAATSVLIISCPCAFGLATPMAIAVASGVGASQGILIKNGAVLEKLAAIKKIIFDKTGTLTKGELDIKSIHVTSASPFCERDILSWLSRLEKHSEHPLAKSIIHYIDDQTHSATLSLHHFHSEAGLGVGGEVDHKKMIVGNRRWLKKQNISIDIHIEKLAKRYESDHLSCVYVAINDQLCALIALHDPLNEEAIPLIKRLKSMGMETLLLSGDRQSVAESVAEKLGGMNVQAEMLPDEKYQTIKSLQSAGDSVIMVGDGVNDAPALMAADVGIAIGSGTDVSIDSADIVLTRHSLADIEQAIRLSKKTIHIIQQNIAIAILYNIVMVPLAMMAMVSPLIAAISMPVSSLLVIANAARLQWIFKR